MKTFTNSFSTYAGFTVLLFYSDDTSLKAINRVADHMKEVLADNTEYFKVNVRQTPRLGESFRVNETPLLLLIHNGREIWRRNGEITETSEYIKLEQLIHSKSG